MGQCQSGAGPLLSPLWQLLWARGWGRELGAISFQRKGWGPSDTRPGVRCRKKARWVWFCCVPSHRAEFGLCNDPTW